MKFTACMMFLVLVPLGGLLPGCGKSGQASVNAAMAKAAAVLEDVGSYKTPQGKPVRVFKATVEYGMKKENLLIVVGDASVPVSMSSAFAVKIGGKTSELPAFSSPAGNVVVAVNVNDPSKSIEIKLDLAAAMSGGPASQGPSAVVAFPMKALNAKISGGTLNLPELDTL